MWVEHTSQKNVMLGFCKYFGARAPQRLNAGRVLGLSRSHGAIYYISDVEPLWYGLRKGLGTPVAHTMNLWTLAINLGWWLSLRENVSPG